MILIWGLPDPDMGTGLYLQKNIIRVFGYANDLDVSYTYQTGQWIHVAGTYDGDTVKAYINGVLVDSAFRPGWNTSGNTYYMGRHHPNYPTGNYFEGDIDDVYIYKRVLDEEEISVLMDTVLQPPSTTSVEPGAEFPQNIELWPNPAHDYFWLKSKNVAVSELHIFDLQGRLIFTQSPASTQINISTLSPGMYLIVLSNKKGEYLGRSRLIKW